MLSRLYISNLVLIDKLEVVFEKGLTVFTGETGAGKSMLLDALGLILGERFESHLLRPGQQSLSITACFEATNHMSAFLDNQGIDQEIYDDDLLLKRTVDIKGEDGKSKGRAFIHNEPVTLNVLKQCAEKMMDIHGQFDRFMDPSYYIDLVDAFGGHATQCTAVKKTYHVWREAEEALNQLHFKQSHAKERHEQLQFDIEELRQLNPQKNEEDLLLSAREALKNASIAGESFQKAATFLAGQGDQGLAFPLIQIQKLLSRCEGENATITRLEQMIVDLHDIESEIHAKATALPFDPTAFEKSEERLHNLRQLARKHKTNANDLADLMQSFQEEYASLEHREEALAACAANLKMCEQEFVMHATHLHQNRVKAANTLSAAIMKELAPLKLEHALFNVAIAPLSIKEAHEKGMDRVDFLFSANPGIEPQSIGKVASGGELSRLMLALKVVLSQAGHVQTQIFDEIDSGVGGATATAIGLRLKRLSKNQQVIAVTHSPQVAAFADHHFKVIKHVKEDQTFVTLEKLQHKERDHELSRMLAGDTVTPEALQAARSLLEQAATQVDRSAFEQPILS